MSEGPIKHERDAWKPPKVSTPDNSRVCARSGTRAYCGRSKSRTVDGWRRVTCTDCRTAYRADGGRIPLIPEVRS